MIYNTNINLIIANLNLNMKATILKLFIATGLFLCTQNIVAQNPVNWTNKQLIKPADLAANLKTNKALPLIFSVGPAATIPHSVEIGMVKDKANLDKFKKQLNGIQKNKKILVDCGCCPYEHCPNVRPAIDALKEMGFTNYFLLDLPQNIKKDWIDKRYPVVK